jgi:predicted RNA-binding protein Jag
LGSQKVPAQVKSNNFKPEMELFYRQAREMIQRIIAKGQGLPDPHQMGDGQTMVEVLVPGPKVGLVIGKGGETIKHLQVLNQLKDQYMLIKTLMPQVVQNQVFFSRPEKLVAFLKN